MHAQAKITKLPINYCINLLDFNFMHAGLFQQVSRCFMCIKTPNINIMMMVTLWAS